MDAEVGLKFLARVTLAAQQELNNLLAELEASKATNNYFPHSEHISPQEEGGGDRSDYSTDNRMFFGDNLLAMLALLKGDKKTGLSSMRGQIDLIYIDPPFASQKKYKTKIRQAGQELERDAYSDVWDIGMGNYLQMLIVRLGLMRELMKSTGSIIVHLDWHCSHYVKILLDELFGQENFRNEIVWCYGGGGAPKKHYPRKHDVLLWYSKSDKWTFNKQYRPYSPGTLARGLTAIKGDRYVLNNEGAGLNDWWADKEVQKILSPTAQENLKYATQKPENLLQRIILGHSNPDDIVADFFAGTGTTAAVANRTNRRWLAVDHGAAAFSIMRRRLRYNSKRAFWTHNLSNILPQVQEGDENSSIDIEITRTPGIDNYERISVLIVSYKLEITDQISASIDRKKLLEMQKYDPLAFVDYWSIDFDYNGEVFCSHWQAFRQLTGKRGTHEKIVSQAEINFVNNKESSKMAIKIVDIFGNERIYIFML